MNVASRRWTSMVFLLVLCVIHFLDDVNWELRNDDMDVLNGIIHVHELEIFRYVNQGVKTVNHDYQTIKRRLDEIKTRHLIENRDFPN